MSGLAWTTPAALFALGALVVPVLLHLAARAHRQGHGFPSLMFLRRVQIRRRRRTRLRDPLLFLLRCLALAALVLAFAGPLTAVDPERAAAAGNEDVVVMLDRSASMAIGGRFEAARTLAAAVLDGVTSAQRAALLTFDEQVEVASGLQQGAAAARAALATVSTGDAGTHGVAALRAAAALIEREGQRRARLVLISDLHRSGLPREARLVLPAGTTVEVLAVPAGTTGAVRVTGARARPAGTDGRMHLDVEIARLGEQWPERAELQVTAEGRRIASHAVPVTREPRALVTTAVVQARDRDLEVTLGLTDSSAPPLRLVVPRAARPRVLIAGEDRGAARQVALALRAGGDDAIEVVESTDGGVDAGQLERVNVLVLLGALPPTAAPLAAFVAAGGGMLAMATPVAADTPLAALLPARPDGPDREPALPVALARLRADHPLAAALGLAPEGVVSARAVWRYQPVRTAEESSVIARFDTGEPAILERRVGDGRVLQWTTGPARPWSEVGLSRSFVPLVRESVRYLARTVELPVAYAVGEFVDLGQRWRSAFAQQPAEAGDWLLQAPDGGQTRLPAAAGVVRLEEQGIYTVRRVDQAQRRLRLAANTPAAEFESALLSAADARAGIDVRPQSERPAAAAMQDLPRSGDGAAVEQWWWELLTLAFVLFLAEAALGNWLSARRRPAPNAEADGPARSPA